MNCRRSRDAAAFGTHIAGITNLDYSGKYWSIGVDSIHGVWEETRAGRAPTIETAQG